jgi:UDP-sugar transporter A1/2/3
MVSTIKIAVLVALVVQNSVVVLLMRGSRVQKGDMFLASTVVFIGEIFKLVTSSLLLLREHKWNVPEWAGVIHRQVTEKPMDNLKISIPALLYLMQNNLVFVAISHMNSATYQVLCQFKIFVTAILSVFLLNKKLTGRHWLALVVLFFGVIMVQQATSTPTPPVNTDHDQRTLLTRVLQSSFTGGGEMGSNRFVVYLGDYSQMDNMNKTTTAAQATSSAAATASDPISGAGSGAGKSVAISNTETSFVGFVAIGVAVLCSGLAGVWFERMLKTTKTSVWLRNLQMSVFSLILSAGSIILSSDYQVIREHGFFHGYNTIGKCWLLDVCPSVPFFILCSVCYFVSLMLLCCPSIRSQQCESRWLV